MKNIPILLLLILIVACKGTGTEPSPSDEMKSILTSGTWNLQSVTVDNVDKTSTYAGLKLNFTATSFTSTNGHVVWPASGTWQFSGDSGKTIVRDDQTQVAIGDASSAKLVMSLTWNKTTLGSGRAESIKGNHVFTFTK